MKRDERLHGLSSDHHHALVLARRLSRAVGPPSPAEAEALRAQFERELDPHFRVEEEVLLPALRAAGQDGLVERTLADHAAIRAGFEAAAEGDASAARTLGERLTDHVRFEERELFPACEAHLPSDVLDEALRRAPGPKVDPPA